MKFKNYKEAQDWMNNRMSEYESANRFYASEEYREAYPAIKEASDREKNNQSSSLAVEARQAMTEAGVKFGDRVSYQHVGRFMTVEEYTGIIINRKGIPFVKFDEGQKTINGKKSVRWHKGFKIA